MGSSILHCDSQLKRALQPTVQCINQSRNPELYKPTVDNMDIALNQTMFSMRLLAEPYVVIAFVFVLVVGKEEEDEWYWAVPYYHNTLQEVFVRWVAGYEEQVMLGTEDMGMMVVAVVVDLGCIVDKVLVACLYN